MASLSSFRQLGVFVRGARPLSSKGLTITTADPTDPDVVWVKVNGVQKPRTQWTYLLSQDEPGRPRDTDIHDRPITKDKLCHSYTELCAWLHTYGFTPPPPEYFAPTPDEIAEGVDSIARPVIRPR